MDYILEISAIKWVTYSTNIHASILLLAFVMSWANKIVELSLNFVHFGDLFNVTVIVYGNTNIIPI